MRTPFSAFWFIFRFAWSGRDDNRAIVLSQCLITVVDDRLISIGLFTALLRLSGMSSFGTPPGRSGNGCGHLTMTSCPDLRTLQRRYSWTPHYGHEDCHAAYLTGVRINNRNRRTTEVDKSFSPARCSRAWRRRVFSTPVATAEVREYPIALLPACALYSIHNSCRVTPGFLISVSRYNMSGITSSDAKVSLGGKMSFLQRVMGYISR